MSPRALPPALQDWWGSTTTRSERAMTVLLIAIACVAIFSTALVQTLVVALTIVAVSGILLDTHGPWRVTPLDRSVLAFLCARIVSIAFSSYPRESIPALWIEFFYYGMFFLVTQTIRRREEEAARVVIVALLIAGVVAALCGIIFVATGIDSRAVSTTAGPYTLGGYLVLLFPLALFFALHPTTLQQWRWQWLVPLAYCVGIVLTFDRLHWVAMGGILIGAMIVSRKRIPLLLTAVVVLALLAIPSVQGRFLQFFHLSENMNGRDVLWRGAAMILTKHPLVGFGPRSFPYIFPLFVEMPVRGVGSWHNDYLQVYMESGLLGLLPLLWLVGATYYHSIRWWRAGQGSPSRKGLVGALLASVTVMFLAGGMLDTIVGIVFRILLALLALLLTVPAPGRESRILKS